MHVCPDTGATQSVVCEDLARQANLVFERPRIGMNGITGHGLHIIGETDVTLEYDGLSLTTSVLVADNISDAMLVCWHDCQALEIISKDFPARLRSVQKDETVARQLAINILNAYPTVFKDKLSETPMNVPEMTIHLMENCVPYRVSTARQVPYRFQEAASLTTKELLEAGIIVEEGEPQPWCAPGFWVPKGDGTRVRLVADYTKINKSVIRPVHPFPSVKDIVQSIPAGTKYFAKMDAVHGYFQLALDEKSSKLTTFLLPSGRYRYLRAPMGLSCSSDEWCRHSDRAIEGLHFARKIVDDILVWATELPQLHERIKVIADRCKDLNIILSRKKFEIGSEISFAGLLLSEKGVKPDPKRIEGLVEFPVPKDVTGVRSFLGLANQLSGFVPDFAHMSVKLRELTAKKSAFIWLEEHQEEFQRIKTLLTSDMVVTHFDPDLPVTLLTDASRLHGLGYAMGHFVDGRFKLVACGSKSLTPTQRRYATIELECLAVHFAISKCSFYLKGAPMFTVATDHKPLEGIFQKDLFEIGNPRLQRIREKLLEYSFQVKWVPGKSHHIADALSRAPLFSMEDEEDMYIDTARACLAQTVERNKELDLILDAVDSDYIRFKHDVKNGTFDSEYAKMMKAVMPQLSVDEELVYMDAKRIVVPRKAVKSILNLAHISHIGVNKTYDLCRSLYFWPGMLNDIKQMIEKCTPCSVNRPSLPKNPRVSKPPSSYLGPPMSQVGVDLFEFGGHQHILCVDQWSGYPLFERLSSTTSASVISQLKRWFNTLGWPRIIRSDGGPQFRGDFLDFCRTNNVVHELSSPYNPSANGLAESAVKIVKSILVKSLGKGGDVQRALYEWRNAPRQHGYSPSQLMFGRSQRIMLPQPELAYRQINFQEAAAAKDKCFESVQQHYDRDKVSQTQLSPGELVRIQDPEKKNWDKLGQIVEMRPDQLSYTVESGGKILIRGRAMLRPAIDLDSSEESHEVDQVSGGVLDINAPPFLPRRSERLKEKENKDKVRICVAPLKRKIPTGNGGSTTPPTSRSQRTKPLTKVPGDFPWLMYSGRLSPRGPLLSSLSGSVSCPSSSVCGVAPRQTGSITAVTPSCSGPFLRPPPQLDPCHLRPVPLVQPCQPPLLLSRTQQMGPSTSGLHQGGQVSLVPTCPRSRVSSPGYPFLSSRPCSIPGGLEGSTVDRVQPSSRGSGRQLPTMGSTPSGIIAAQQSSTAPGSLSLQKKRMREVPPRFRVPGGPAARTCVVPLPGEMSASQVQKKMSPGNLPQSRPGSRELEFMRKINSETARRSIAPKMSLKDYNEVRSSRPGSIFNMKVFF